VIRPDGTQVITVIGRDGQLLRRIRRDERGREIIIIDNSYRDPRAVGGFYVALPPPVVRIPYDRYIVDSEDAPPDLIYDTMVAPPVDRIERRYSLDEIRYSPNVRQLMPSIDVTRSTSKPALGKYRRIRQRSCRRSRTDSTAPSRPIRARCS